jgi:hypothetical protein
MRFEREEVGQEEGGEAGQQGEVAREAVQVWPQVSVSLSVSLSLSLYIYI